jgi:hypothetical protein
MHSVNDSVRDITILYNSWMRYGIAIIGRLQAEDTEDLEDSTLDRVLGQCCGAFILPLAKSAKTVGLLKRCHLTMDLTRLNSVPYNGTYRIIKEER